jgi:glucose-6-phosphate 1-dehydrogenase
MEAPKNFDASSIRKERAKILSLLKPYNDKNIKKMANRGQYEGYINEKGVKRNSQTETYFRLETYIENSRWKGVPFYLESGKGLNESKSEIDIYFKNEHDSERQNILTFRIQPDEGIKIRFFVKTPGFDTVTEPKILKFKYSDHPTLQTLPDAYERVLYDAIKGDQTLFTSTDEVLHAWKFITPILSLWRAIPLNIYKKGSEDML